MNNYTTCVNNLYFYGLLVPVSLSATYNGYYITLSWNEFYEPDVSVEIWVSRDNEPFELSGTTVVGASSYKLLSHTRGLLAIKIRVTKNDVYSDFTQPIIYDLTPSLQRTANIQMNLDVSAITGLVHDDPITIIPDTTGKGNNAGQIAVNRNPLYKTNSLNGLPSAQCDGIDDAMNLGNDASIDVDDNITIMVVYKTTNEAVRQTLFGQQDAANGFQLELGLNANSRNTIISGVIVTGQIASNVPGYEILTYRRNGAGANHIFRRNGVTMTLTTNAANSYVPTGAVKELFRRDNANQYFIGNFCQMVLWDATLTDTELLDSERFLSEKWNLPIETEQTDADFSIIVIPDTQEWVTDDIVYNAYMLPMMQYIGDLPTMFKLKNVSHLGDITLLCNNAEWLRWNNAFAYFDKNNVPFLASTGNHDYDGGVTQRPPNAVRFRSEYPITFYNTKKWWIGDFYEPNASENHYFKFTVGANKYLIIQLEFGARQGAIDWANNIISRNKDHNVIFMTHCYSMPDGTRVGFGDVFNPHTLIVPDVDVHDGDEIWTELVKLAANNNIIQVWSGHESGFVATEVTGDGGNDLQEILAAHITNVNQNGSIAIAHFYLAAGKVKLVRYSPGLKTSTYRNMINLK
jgi:hypothetical protein